MLLLEAMTRRDTESRSACASTEALERLLSSHAGASKIDLSWLRDRAGTSQVTHAAGTDITPEVCQTSALLVCRGWVANGAVLNDGRRQIISVHLAGDFLRAPDQGGGDVNIWALTPAATVEAGALWRDLETGSCPSVPLQQAWISLRATERARVAQHIVRLGRLSAYERCAHFFLELHDKQLRNGLGTAGAVLLPLSQDVLADLLGLSAVHINRTLQQLRRDGLIAYSEGRVLLPDLPGLTRAACITP